MWMMCISKKIETFSLLTKKKNFFYRVLLKKILLILLMNLDFLKNNNISYKIINYSNNNVTIEFYSSTDGYLSYVDNFDLFWRAYINKNEVEIFKLMNTYKSIYFEKGKFIRV